MRKFHSARVQQQETVKSSGWQSTHIQSRLDMLAEDLTILRMTIHEPVIVLHFRLLLADLNHVVQVSHLNWEAGLLPLTIDQALMLLHLPPSCRRFILSVVTSVDLRIVDRLCNA